MIRDVRGFSLIELMIVTVLIGVLAMIALPMFGQIRYSTNVAVLKGELHGIAKAQELYYVEHGSYTDRLEELDFTPDRDVVVTLSVEGSGPGGTGQGGGGDGWTSGGWAGHAAYREHPVECALFTGDAAPLDPAEQPGVVACETD